MSEEEDSFEDSESESESEELVDSLEELSESDSDSEDEMLLGSELFELDELEVDGRCRLFLGCSMGSCQ